MKLAVYLINKDIYTLSEDVDFTNVKIDLPHIKGISKCHVDLTAKKYDELVNVDLDITADVTVVSSYTLKEGNRKVHIKETLIFSGNEEDASEDYYIAKSNIIDLDEYIYSLIIADIPDKIVLKGEKAPASSESYRVMSEEEYYNEKSKNKSSPFDKIPL